MDSSPPSDDYRARIFRNYQDSMARELEVGRAIESPEIYHPTYRKHYLPRLPKDLHARIVDVGCGLGNLVAFLRQQGYTNAAGVDWSPQMVRLAQGRGVPAQQAEAVEYLRAHPGQFDCILAMDVLEHMHKNELVAFLDAAHQALRDGGSFLAHTVNADGLSWGRMRYIDLTHEIAFTRYSLAQLFTVAGFRRYEFYPVEPTGSGLRGAFRKALWKVFRLGAGLYYHVEMGSGILRNDHILTASLVGKAVKSD